MARDIECDKLLIKFMHYADSLSLFDFIGTDSSIPHKSLVINVESVHKACKHKGIENIVFVCAWFNPADALTK